MMPCPLTAMVPKVFTGITFSLHSVLISDLLASYFLFTFNLLSYPADCLKFCPPTHCKKAPLRDATPTAWEALPYRNLPQGGGHGRVVSRSPCSGTPSQCIPNLSRPLFPSNTLPLYLSNSLVVSPLLSFPQSCSHKPSL